MSPIAEYLVSRQCLLSHPPFQTTQYQTQAKLKFKLTLQMNSTSIPFNANQVQQYYMNLGEMDENGQLKIAENVKQLYDIWEDIKEDDMRESSQTDKDMTENI